MATYFPNDITSANSTLVITVESLYPSGFQVQNYGADAAAVVDAVQIIETRMGVDGHMAAGYTPAIIPLTVTLEASSPSYAYFSTVYQAQRTNKCVYKITAVLSLPAISRTYTFKSGALVGGTPIPGVQKTLQPTTWNFNFEDMTPSKTA